MKFVRALMLMALCLIPLSAAAQSCGSGYTQLTGTYAPYANGSVNAGFVNQSSGLPLLNGSVFPTFNSTNFDSSGVFNFCLADNNVIRPTPTQWKVTACQHGGAQPGCCSETITVTGSTQDISTFLGTCPFIAPQAVDPTAVHKNTTAQQTMNGPLALPATIVSGGSRIDVTSYGAKCDGTTDDAAAIQSALNTWALGSRTLTFPTGQTCLAKSNLTVTFNTQPSGPLTIDMRTGRLLFQVATGTDLHIVTGATNIYPDDITLENGTWEDAGSGASVLVDVDGSSLANTGMSRVVLSNATFKADGYTTTAFQTESTFQSRCVNSRAYAPYGAISSAVLGYYGFALLPKTGSGQDTSDWTFDRCESFGFDHGLYGNTNEIRVNAGTYLLSYEAPVFLNGANYAHQTHVENGWLNNASGGGGQRPGLQCIGPCEIDGVIANNNLGNQNSAVQIFSGSGQNSTLKGGTFYNLGTAGYVYAYLGAAAGPPAGEIDVTGIPLVSGSPSWSLYTGSSSSVTVRGAGNIEAATFNGLVLPSGGIYGSNQATNPQWIQTYSTASGSGYILHGQAAGGGATSEIYFASSYGAGSWGITGEYIDGNGDWHYQQCTTQTGITPPNLATPSGCTDKAHIVVGTNPLVLSAANIFSGSVYTFTPSGGVIAVYGEETLTSAGGTVTLSDYSTVSTVTISGNITFSIGAGSIGGARKDIVVCQDATGAHTVTWPANMRGGMTVGATASKCSGQSFAYSSGQSAWLAVSAGSTNE